MGHVVVVDGSRTVVRDTLELGRNGKHPRLRFHSFGSGDLAVLAAAGARMDGRPMVGGVAVVDWGRGAVIRALDVRIEVRWEAERETGPAPGNARCGLCFGPIAAGETIVCCYCRTPVHERCFGVLITCARCGEAA